MLPRLHLFSVPRALAFRSKPPLQKWRPDMGINRIVTPYRTFADSKNDSNEGPNTDILPDVSHEAAKMAEITGVGGPELEQGTLVNELLKDDKEAQEKLPKVMRDALKKAAAASSTTNPPSASRSFSTEAARRETVEVTLPAATTGEVLPSVQGLKFHMPMLPIPKDGHLQYRYDPVVNQVTNLLMRHGELGKAQRNMARILEHLRTAPAPKLDPRKPLLPGAPPAFHLPLNPVLYLTLAVDSVAPLMRIRSQKGAAGGGMALQIPVPLGQRQRRRAAMQWIIAAASKRKNRGSGKDSFALRVADEIVAVVQGTSSVWERRNALHKLGVAARANIAFASANRRR